VRRGERKRGDGERRDDGPDDLFVPAPLPQAPLDDRQRVACLRLIRSDSVGPVAFRELINLYGGAQEALDALPELARRSGRRRPMAICSAAAAEAELEAAARCGAQPLFTIEPGYPVGLAAAEVPPPLIYVRGRVDLLARPSVAMVGSRESSAAGLALARAFAANLGQAGYVVTSGLARGIDTAAHAAALPTGTIAVLAGGIDHVYPQENAALLDAIAGEGCVVSEQPPGFRPRGTDFPRRNRIIAGISLGVVIVEAAMRSGSLITARFAGELGREVMAVPGHPLDPRAAGTNALLKDGATLVTSADEVIAALALSRDPLTAPTELREPTPLASFVPPSPAKPPLALPPDDIRTMVLGVLGPAPVAVDEIARVTGLAVRDVQTALLELSLAGEIVAHGSQLVSRRMD